MEELHIERYAAGVSTPQDALLEELERVTYLRAVHPQMLSGHLQGKLLEMLVRMLRPRNILEIGTFTGYSALCMAAGLEPGATLDTIEADDELQGLAQSFFDRSPYGDKIRLHIGSALEIAPKLGRTYDLVFIDGDKKEYPAYLEMILAGLVHPGSWILADNILWYGKAASQPRPADRQTGAIRRFNAIVAADARLENVIVPVRDGLNLIRVK